MENLCIRFPVASEMVLKNLDDPSLKRSKLAGRGMAEFLENEKFYWIRIIKKYIVYFEGHEKSWREVVNKTPLGIIKQLAIAVQHFFKKHSFKELAPLHIAAEKGTFQLCQYVIAKTSNKNPSGNFQIVGLFLPNFKIAKGKPFPSVSYTHLTLPTKRIV